MLVCAGWGDRGRSRAPLQRRRAARGSLRSGASGSFQPPPGIDVSAAALPFRRPVDCRKKMPRRCSWRPKERPRRLRYVLLLEERVLGTTKFLT